MAKLKLASYWMAGCGGCDTAILDTHEKILDIAAAADIVFWPIATDFKVKDVEAMADGSIDVTLLNGAIRNSENEHIARLLRKKSKVLVAFGSCAHLGGIPGLANVFTREQIFQRVYKDSPSTVNGNGTVPLPKTKVPEGELELPVMFEKVRTAAEVVDVDYFMPGCPPAPAQIWNVVQAIVSGKLPPKGSVIGAEEKTLCEDCTREKREKKIKAFKRYATERPDPNVCFLEQGFLCMGMATRAGCGHRCHNSGMGCRGCYGPPPGVVDQGAKAISALASIIDASTEEEIDKVLAEFPDVLRSVNRFGIPGSLLRRSVT
jgi:F420-non-reducing hydrogenase small subunit